MALPLVRLGSTGVKVPRICLGTMGFGSKAWRPWVLDEADALPILKRALDLGVFFWDTADMYSLGASERVIGKALQGHARDEIVLATKVFHPVQAGPNAQGLSRKHIESALRASLDRLGTDHVDLYQTHRFDAETPMEETLSSLSALVDAGKTRYLGASTMWAWQFATMLGLQKHHGWHRFVTIQDHYNLVYREEEREMLPLCRHEGIGILPWSPLARGVLAGSTSGERARTDAGRAFYDDPASLELVERVHTLAKERSVSSAQVALAWLLHQPGVTAPIVGVTKMAHLEDAVRATELRLSDKELGWLEEPYKPRAVAGWFRGGGVPRVHLDEDEP